ncbi:hypothetical protein [Mesorhizobium sp. 8]|uniref:hypothetical protein n=1 Tax=Mesorhizobium sp. 8 TaxID=2584466 RepID=UPI00111EFEBF|nr:hypothetical protein [Mesorhizobium sp. 8]QDC01868.1 hypothetical protein FGU64_16335 [Mesorhizobium sp. 8]
MIAKALVEPLQETGKVDGAGLLVVNDAVDMAEPDIGAGDVPVDGFQETAIAHGALGVPVADQVAIGTLQPDDFSNAIVRPRQHDISQAGRRAEG